MKKVIVTFKVVKRGEERQVVSRDVRNSQQRQHV